MNSACRSTTSSSSVLPLPKGNNPPAPPDSKHGPQAGEAGKGTGCSCCNPKIDSVLDEAMTPTPTLPTRKSSAVSQRRGYTSTSRRSRRCTPRWKAASCVPATRQTPGWADNNRRMCDLLHRGRVPPRVTR